MAKEKSPSIIFIMETKCNDKSFEIAKAKLKYANCFYVKPVGKKGGLAMFWSNDSELQIINYSQYYIHAQIMDDDVKSR